jgi:alpha-tubulin suppressor-like RCC1 family protein
MATISSHARFHAIFEDPSLQIELAFIFSENNAIVLTKKDEVYKLETDICDFIGIGSGKRKPKLLKGLYKKQIESFAGGEKHFYAISKTGNIYCSGNNKNGELGNGTNEDILEDFEENSLLSALKLTKIRCGSSHSLALNEDGDVYGWGNNQFGQTGNKSDLKQLCPNKVQGISEKVVQISCGLNHSMALTENGLVYCWGQNDCGQLGINKIKSSKEAKLLTVEESKIKLKFLQIACGERHSLLLSRYRKVYAFGSNEFGQLGRSDIEKSCNVPLRIDCEPELDFTEIASHFSCNFSAALQNGQIVYTWGKCLERDPQEAETETMLMRKRARPTISNFEKINDVFNKYMKISYEPFKFDFDYNEYLIQNGRYEREFEEGTKIYGGFSIRPPFNCEVCKAKNKWNKRNYIIKKVIFKHEDRERVFREIEMFAKSSKISAHVVQYYSSWFEFVTIDAWNGSTNSLMLYIQMELCKKNLQDLIDDIYKKKDRNLMIPYELSDKRRRQNLTKLGYFIACELLREILEDVQYLHDLNIIHRDLKEVNILITKGRDKRFVKIGDFGESKLLKPEELNTSDRGTITHQAPEVSDNRNEDNRTQYNHKADVWSIGCVVGKLFNIDPNWM